jgi:hypothetical protein
MAAEHGFVCITAHLTAKNVQLLYNLSFANPAY